MKKFIRQEGLYLASLFLISLPPAYFLFAFVNLHSLAKIIWLFLFGRLVVGFLKGWRFKEINLLLLWLFLLFFVSQSLSVISAKNIEAFLRQYEDVLFTAVFVVISFAHVKRRNINRIACILIAFGFINLIFQLAIFVFPNAFLKIGDLFLHQGYLDLIELNIERKRIYFEAYDEMLIPLLVYFAVQRKERKKKLLIILLIGIFLFSFLSNFRTRFLMFIAGLIGTLFVIKDSTKRFWKYFFLAIIPIYILYSVLTQTVGFTVFERLALKDKREDVKTITSRVERWQKAAEIGFSAPVLGVGLGNYYDYLDSSTKYAFTISEQALKEFESAIYYPHNIFFKIFAETGFFGLSSFLLLVIYFSWKDWKILRQKRGLTKAFVISFWVIFLYALFNPSFTTKYQFLFWLVRIIIEKLSPTRFMKKNRKISLCLK